MTSSAASAPPPDGDRLDQLLDRVDAVDAVAALMFACNTGCRTVDGAHVDVPLVALEYACCRVVQRGAPAARTSGAPVRTDELAAAAQRAMIDEEQEQWVEAFGDDPLMGLDSDPRWRLAQSGKLGYDPALEGELERMPILFGHFADELEQATGAHPAEVARFAAWVAAERLRWALAYAEVRAPPASATEAWALCREAAEAGVGAHVGAGAGAAAALALERAEAGACIPADRVERIADLFTLSTHGEGTAFGKFVWELRRKPLTRVGEHLLAISPQLLIAAMRPLLERTLESELPKARSRYDLAKGRWLERSTLALLEQALPFDEAYRSLRVPRVEGRGAERDGMMRIDGCGLAIEAKGRGISPGARSGDPFAQDKAIQRAVHEGVEQADSLIDALTTRQPVHGIDVRTNRRDPVTDELVDFWIPLVVTLEDLGGVVASTRATFGDREGKPVPIVVSIDDLRWYASVLRLPAQLLHYFVVRGRIGRSKARLVILDERDWFRAYVHHGSERLHHMLQELASAGPVVAAGLDLRHGELEPRPLWRTPYEAQLRRWQEERTPGWLEASFALLDLSPRQAAALPALIAEMFERAVSDDMVTLATLPLDADPDTAIHLVAMGPEEAKAGTWDAHRIGRLIGDDVAKVAPDARRHVVLATCDGAIETLQMLGVGDLLSSDAARALAQLISPTL